MMTKIETPMAMNTCTWQQSQNIPSHIRDAKRMLSACFRKVPASRQQTPMNFLRRPTRNVACGSHCELLPREVALHVRSRHESASKTSQHQQVEDGFLSKRRYCTSSTCLGECPRMIWAVVCASRRHKFCAQNSMDATSSSQWVVACNHRK
uniref:Putative wd-repeat protein n=1 Tax=Ixodes ricinus TaxID=34613 RepID=A0A0K8R9V3_IXORI